MPEILDIKTIFFSIWGYPMSYLEFAGVVIGGVAVWLSAQANVWSWPVGAVSVTLYFFIFLQIQLYPDMFLQVFFLITNIQGWWRWKHPAPGEENQQLELKISRMPARQLVSWSAMGLLGTLALGTFAQNLHIWLPLVFNQPSAFPYLDSFTTVMSIMATYMMIQKRVECWYAWLLVDAILTYVYFVKGIKVVSIEYSIFCLIALKGAYFWTREYRSYSVSQT
ncbi:nicotinamide riboside transporter PnuC [Fibrella aquatica]|uniref:nicotinamide riboside transporter PnuC n=1 Tax=Fibrella aquatica TaxID=3242487 RepID=UPI003522BFBE